MAKVVVNSNVMQDKSKTIESAAGKIQSLYEEMSKEIQTMSSKMKGETIDESQQRFTGMKPTFEAFCNDMKAYGNFLTQAAEAYEAAEREGVQKAREQGKIF